MFLHFPVGPSVSHTSLGERGENPWGDTNDGEQLVVLGTLLSPVSILSPLPSLYHPLSAPPPTLNLSLSSGTFTSVMSASF